MVRVRVEGPPTAGVDWFNVNPFLVGAFSFIVLTATARMYKQVGTAPRQSAGGCPGVLRARLALRVSRTLHPARQTAPARACRITLAYTVPWVATGTLRLSRRPRAPWFGDKLGRCSSGPASARPHDHAPHASRVRSRWSRALPRRPP